MNFGHPNYAGLSAELSRDRVNAACEKHLSFQIRPSQWDASRLLSDRCIVEMPTGEGKTLTTLLAACSLAATGQRVLIATANDYLASRDADWMAKLYNSVGLSVSSVTASTPQQTRSETYKHDVVYGTLREFAFDFLRHSLERRKKPASNVARSEFPDDILIIDEADSILIDEARTPMIITAPITEVDQAKESCYRWASNAARGFQRPRDYVRIDGSGLIALTQVGRQHAIAAPMPTTIATLTTTEILHALERAILVNETIHRDIHYVVHEDSIQLVDEYTGRRAADRNFGGGVQQAIEAREGLTLTQESEPIARISVQDFVSRFRHLGGMTATVWEDRDELQRVYDVKIHRVRPHRRSQQILMPPVACRSLREKWVRIADETAKMIKTNRSVLIGTRTIAQSEELSRQLSENGISHVVLNARNAASEAEIIAEAGQTGRVTVATNMAGRGTDIRLSEEVRKAGGMHVIVSEAHAASRIDRQLIGRSSRQGDPGSARLFVSPADEILAQAYGEEQSAKFLLAAKQGSIKWLLPKVLSAQKRVTRMHRKERAELTAHDESLSDAMLSLGMDPHLDPLHENH
jgi:preprotein translocase subunit SecA